MAPRPPGAAVHSKSSTRSVSGTSVRSVASVRKSNARSRSRASVAAQLRGSRGVHVPLTIVVWNRFEMAEPRRAPRPLTSRPSPADPGSHRRHRRRAPGSPESTTAARRTSGSPRSRSQITRVRRFNCTMRSPRTHWARSLSGVQITTRPTRESSANRSRRRRQRIVGLELHHRPDDEAQRDSTRPRGSGTATRAPGRCLRSSCNRPQGCCETTR